MCLFVDTRKCEVAEEDIVVYKYVAKRIKILEGDHAGLVMHRDDANYVWWKTIKSEIKSEIVWVSPYQTCSYVIYKPGITLTDPRFQDTACDKGVESTGYKIFNGLHTFAWSKDAILRAETFVTVDGGSGVLECVIPKGTRYWTDGDEYCSEKLEVKELIYETD
jgi:hypothetical protein